MFWFILINIICNPHDFESPNINDRSQYVDLIRRFNVDLICRFDVDLIRRLDVDLICRFDVDLMCRFNVSIDIRRQFDL